MSLEKPLARALCLLALAAAAASPVIAQPAHLVRDIVTARDSFEGDANPGQLTPFGAKLAFTASEDSTGREVWISDSESRRTYILGDICRDYCPDGPVMIGALGPTLFFLQARAQSSQQLLWASDGTVRGTRPVLDTKGVEDYALLPDRVLFLIGGESGLELWRTDGTAGGTAKVATVAVLGARDAVFLVSGSRATLLLWDYGTLAVWSTDGSTAGTRKLATLSVSLGPGERQAATATHGFFVAITSAGQELWASDGTAAGTRAVTSFEAPDPFETTQWFKPIGKNLYFIVNDVTHGYELWRSDGTPKGTTRVTEFGYAFPFEGLTNDALVEELNGQIVFLASDGLHPVGLWTSNGSPSSTRPLSEVCANRCEASDDEGWLVRLGNRLFFPAFSLTRFNSEVWSTDGTAAGSAPLIGPCPPTCVGAITRPTVLGDRLYFVDGGGDELWSSDGTSAGTHEVTHFDDAEPFDVFFPRYTPELAAAGGRIWFGADQYPYGQELWSTAGAPETTELAGDVNRASGSSAPASLAAIGDRLLFLAARCPSGSWGYDPWVSDGSSAQRLSPFVDDCYSGFDSDQPIVAGGGYGFWWEDDAELKLWRTDGTPGGTIALMEFPDLYFPPTLLPLDGGVAFVVEDPSTGTYSFWRSDGTTAGTIEKATLPGDPDFSFGDGQSIYFLAAAPQSARQLWRADLATGSVVPLTAFGANEGIGNIAPLFTKLGNQIYFWLWPLGHSIALWRTDGTSAGTASVFDLPSGAGYPVSSMSNVAGALYFFTGVEYSSTSYQLWRVDSSLVGATRLVTFARRLDGTLPALDLMAAGGTVLFVGDDAEHGRELWSTDGTPEGTHLLRDLLVGPGSSSPTELTAAAGKVFFTAGDAAHGRELWQSDGTAAGTGLVHDIAPEALSAEPTHLTVAGSNLFFAADDGLHGREPWVLPLGGPTTCVAADTVLCLGGGRFRVEAEWRDFANRSGVGHAAALTADTGTFWFFSPSNVEVVLKVLDGRGVNGHQWVFYGALSSVEYTLTVTDTQTGTTRRYFNPAGRLASVGDTDAFGPRGAAAAARSQARDDAGASLPPIVAERHDAAAATVCVPSATRLCLGGNRFAVEVAWRDFAGNTGAGTATVLSSDTGDFWFFNADNVELLVKVLDGRPVNGKFWLFYGALSSVQYTLTVTDTQTGAVRTYTNPSGRLASFADTAAF